MPSQNGNGGRRGPWGSGAKSGSNLEDLVRQGQDRLNQIMQSGGPRRAIVLAVLALVGLGAWTAYYADDANDVVILQDVSDVSKARTWLDSKEMKSMMEKSGVIGSPSIRFAAAA